MARPPAGMLNMRGTEQALGVDSTHSRRVAHSRNMDLDDTFAGAPHFAGSQETQCINVIRC